MRQIAQKYKDQGEAGEKAFAAWLDRSVLPYIYVEQSKITLPQSLKGDIKRPDYIVGLPLIGSVCCDVKCKKIYRKPEVEPSIIFNEWEFRRLANFQLFFMSSVWVVCFDPDNMNTCYLFLNEWLLQEKVETIQGRRSVRMPMREMLEVDVTRTRFQDAMMRAVDLKVDDWKADS